ncbi:MAG: hypothetical protein ACPF9D_13870 [Owenweeksia sp.]
MNVYSKIALLLCMVSLAGCHRPGAMDAVAYSDFLDDNWHTLTDSREINGIIYQVRYLPNDYRILERYGQQLNAEMLETERQNLAEFQYFQVRLKSTRGNILETSVEEDGTSASALHYYTYNFARDIRLVNGTDTLSCAAHQFIPNHGISPWVSVMAAFRATGDQTSDKRIEINDPVFHNGKVVLKIPAKAIAKLPQLTLSKS